jgi:hypothetical protein
VQQDKYAQMAIAASRKSLDLAPLNSFVWIRLASANVMLGPENIMTLWKLGEPQLQRPGLIPFFCYSAFTLVLSYMQN